MGASRSLCNGRESSPVARPCAPSFSLDLATTLFCAFRGGLMRRPPPREFTL